MNKYIIGIILVLVVIVGITAYLNRGSIADKKALEHNAQVLLKENGEEVKEADFEFVKEQGETTFEKDLDTSDSGPEPHTFTGVPLRNVLQEAGIGLKDKEQIITKAIDGYTVALTADEVRQEDNVYLVYKTDGELLKGKSEGGTGPYRIVIKEDEFGQRWAKFVVEIEAK